MSEKQSEESVPGKNGGKRPGAGRPKGAVAKSTALIRDMVSDALDELGGVDYLKKVAESHPGPFLGLIGKVMPVQITGEDGDAIKHSIHVTFG